MWPLDLPAREVLTLPGETVIPWAVFDWQWYLRTYPGVAGHGAEPQAVLDYYLDAGQTQGHSPNRLFDEQWHRRMYPRIAERVLAGEWASAFDAYCRRGALDRSPHWLFDELAYRDRYPDLTNGVLAEFALFNAYDHYLRHGQQEDRVGHPLFDPRLYLSHFDPADVAAIRGQGVFQHYLNRIESGEPELRTSIYFDPVWYLSRYREVARSVEAGRWKSALHHYLCNDTPTAFDPLDGFSESWYLRRDPGLCDVIAAGAFRNGYMHFLRFGAAELRAPSAIVDLGRYAVRPTVRFDLEQARAPDAFAHWLMAGAPEELSGQAPEIETMSARHGEILADWLAIALLPVAGRFGYRFECPGEPAVSVVMAVRNGFAATMATIESLRSGTALAIELIIVDRGSGDETRSIGQYVPDARILRFESDIGWSRAADAGRQLATAPMVLFLSANARIAPGSVERARSRLIADASVGAVGGLILQPHGVIAAAGGIVWNDGAIHAYMHGASPLAPEANFVRATDFCPLDLLLVRSALLTDIDGLDHDCAAGYQAADLCLRIAQAGFTVMYDPSAMLILGETPESGVGPGEHFPRKHAAALANRFAPGGPVQAFARHAGAKPHRVLVIEDTVPLRRSGSGFVRSNDLLHIMAALGYAVTVFPVNRCEHDPAAVFADMPDTAEAMHTLSFGQLAAFLSGRPGYYDTLWIARTHNLARVHPILSRLIEQGTLTARIIFDTEAVTPGREAMQATLSGASFDVTAAMRAIADDARICQLAVAVTQSEAEMLRQHGLAHIAVIGHAIEPAPTVRPFAQRAGMLFVGAIHTADSPNLDSLIWFADAVLPLIEAELRWETRLTIAGYVAPGIDLSRFAHHPRITLRGSIPDLTPLYNAHRVFVAPTRYAAGAPYKVLEAASRGLPVVATEVLRGQLDWMQGRDILSASADDPERFAAGVLSLYRDEALWGAIRQAAIVRLEQDHGLPALTQAVAAAVKPAERAKVTRISPRRGKM